MKWRWFRESPLLPPIPEPAPEPVLDPRVVHEAAKLDAGLAALEERVHALGRGESMKMMLDDVLRVMKK